MPKEAQNEVFYDLIPQTNNAETAGPSSTDSNQPESTVENHVAMATRLQTQGYPQGWRKQTQNIAEDLEDLSGGNLQNSITIVISH